MQKDPPRPSTPIHIESLDDLRAREDEIVQRINSMSHGGRLLMLHPLRCLREAGVTLSEHAVREWEDCSRLSLTRPSGMEGAYNGVAANSSESPVRVKIRRLLPDGRGGRR